MHRPGNDLQRDVEELLQHIDFISIAEIFHNCVDEVTKLINESTQTHLAYFVQDWCDGKLITYHHSLGQHLRNMFLWHSPVIIALHKKHQNIIDGVDYSLFHPDTISMCAIQHASARYFSQWESLTVK